MSPSLLLSLSSKPSLLRKLALFFLVVLSPFSLSDEDVSVSSVYLTTTLPQEILPSHTLGIRMFSSSNPYLMYGVTSGDKETQEAGTMTKLLVFDPAKEEDFAVCDKPFPKELVESRLVGSSHGWGVFLIDPGSILISDFCNPSSSKSNPKFIPLHPRRNLHGSQSEIVSGLAMSSSPEEQDCATAVKYTGRLVRVDTPGRDIKGKLIVMPLALFDYFEQSMLMYSKRDQRLYMPSSGGHHLWSWDGLQLHSSTPQFHELRFHNLPQFSHSELRLLDSCYKTQHIVESPSGQRFLVKWYAQSPPANSVALDCGGTKQFMVFREEEDMNMSYTEDIGDLCIFLGNNEPFCLNASSFPRLKPNSIYFAGDGYGVYDIATRTPRSFPRNSPLSPGKHYLVPHWAPHWIPPFPL